MFDEATLKARIDALCERLRVARVIDAPRETIEDLADQIHETKIQYEKLTGEWYRPDNCEDTI